MLYLSTKPIYLSIYNMFSDKNDTFMSIRRWLSYVHHKKPTLNSRVVNGHGP